MGDGECEPKAKPSKAGDHSRGRQCDRGGRGEGRTPNSYPAYTRPGAIGQEGEWRTRQCIRVFRGGFISDGIRCCSMTSAGR